MATITLRAYLEELNTLIEQEALEEVIGHCRHILQYFPKNLESYRLLGKTLLEKARYDEAGQVFPRILSADPSDFVAHVGLSTIYENKNEIRRALWHMERAFEQMPNQSAIGDEIRRLYELMGKIPPQKIKMTRGALAKQYASNGMYDQALSEVRQALQENPQRLDLKILLAETLWQANYPVEAGEMALEVLQSLPDSLAANILMAKLWLVSQRPDDAKPFLKHVEDLAPYESLKLIYQANNQKAEVPDTAFTLARLDWTAAAAAGFGDESPDWVNKISDVFQMSDRSAVTGAESVGETTSPMAAIDLDDDRPSPFADDEIPDWVMGTGSLSGDTGPTSVVSNDLPDWFSEGADFGGKPQTGALSAPEEWFNELSDKVSQTGSLAGATPPPTEEDSKPFVSGFTGMLDDLSDADAADDLDNLRAAASAPSQDEIDALIASARGEPAFAPEIDENPPPNWLDSTPNEPDWGNDELDSADDFTPDWFKVESSDDDLSTLLDEGLVETEVDLFDDLESDEDEEFATLFGEMPEAQAEEDLVGLFGTDDEAFGADLFDEPDTEEADLRSFASSNLETPEDDLDALFGDITAETESEGFASIFGEGDLDDEPSLFGNNDDGLSSMFDEPDGLEAFGDFGSAHDEDIELSSLFGNEVEVDTSFLSATGFSPTETPAEYEEAEPDLASLFGNEAAGLDTSWLSEGAGLGDMAELSTEADAEPDLDSLFGNEVEVDTSFLSATGFSPTETPAEYEEAEPDLASLFGSEAAGLDTSWLSEGVGLGDMAELSTEADAEPDLDSLFGNEVEVDTSFLAATGFSSTEPPAEYEEAESDLASLFGNEVEGLDTSWRSEEASRVGEFEAAEDEFDLDLFGEDTIEFETIDEPEEDDFDSLFIETETRAEADDQVESFALTDATDAEDSDEFDALFADEVGINTGFLKSTGFEDMGDAESDLFADLDAADEEEEFADTFGETEFDEAFSHEAPQLMDTSWLSSSLVEEPADFATSGDEDFDTMFSAGTDMATQPVDALAGDDWLSVESSDLTTEEVDIIDTLLEENELPEPTVDDLAELFDDEGITVDTSFLRSMESSAEDEFTMAEAAVDLGEPDDDDFGALFDSPTGVTGFLQTAELVEPDESVLDDFLADAVAEKEAEEAEEAEPEVDAELGNALFAEVSEGEEELDLDSLFGGALASADFAADDGEDILLRHTTADEESSELDDFFSEIEEAGLDVEPDLEDFFDPADLDFVTSEVQTVSVTDHIPNEIEDFMSDEDAVTVETVDDEDLDAIFGRLASDSPTDVDFAELLDTDESVLETEDTFASDVELDAISTGEEGTPDFATLLDDEDDFTSFLEEDSLEAVSESDFDQFVLTDEGEDEFVGLLEEETSDAVGELDLEDLLDDEDELMGEFELIDELADDFVTEDDLADLLEEDGASSSDVDSISVDEFASVFGSVDLPDEMAEPETFAGESFADYEVEFDEVEALAENDDDLFTAMTSGGETIGLIEDSELAEELDWVTDFAEEDEVVAAEPTPAPPTQLPEVPRVQFNFSREPRWMRVLKNTQSATMVNDVAVKSDDSGLFDTFDELLDDDLLDDNLTDWLE